MDADGSDTAEIAQLFRHVSRIILFRVSLPSFLKELVGYRCAPGVVRGLVDMLIIPGGSYQQRDAAVTILLSPVIGTSRA
jgi:hypothetical protein